MKLAARDLPANRLALELKVPSGRITEILNGKRGISAETALRLARFIDNSARFWLSLQTAHARRARPGAARGPGGEAGSR